MRPQTFKVYPWHICLLICLVMCPLLLSAAAPTPDIGSHSLEISQMYMVANNSTSTSPYAYNYVEIFNAGPVPVDLQNWTIQYQSGSSTSNFGGSATYPIGSLDPYKSNTVWGPNGDGTYPAYQLTYSDTAKTALKCRAALAGESTQHCFLQPGQYLLVLVAPSSATGSEGFAFPLPADLDISTGTNAGAIAPKSSDGTLGWIGGTGANAPTPWKPGTTAGRVLLSNSTAGNPACIYTGGNGNPTPNTTFFGGFSDFVAYYSSSAGNVCWDGPNSTPQLVFANPNPNGPAYEGASSGADNKGKMALVRVANYDGTFPFPTTKSAAPCSDTDKNLTDFARIAIGPSGVGATNWVLHNTTQTYDPTNGIQPYTTYTPCFTGTTPPAVTVAANPSTLTAASGSQTVNLTITVTPSSSPVATHFNPTATASGVTGATIATPFTDGGVDGNGVHTYTTTATLDTTNPETLTITANAADDAYRTGTSTTTVTVQAPSNHAPVALDSSVNVTYGTPTTLTLTATDADLDPLTYSIATPPANGDLGAISGNSVVYTPHLGYFGPDSFTFKANDGKADSNVATVTINVQGIFVSPSSGAGSIGTPQTFVFTYTNANGFADINAAQMYFNTQPNYVGGCSVWYDNRSNWLFLFTGGSNNSWDGPATPGTAATLNSDQCSIDASQTSVSNPTANQLAISLSVTFKPGFVGSKNVYAGMQSPENVDSGWKPVGTWTPGALVSAGPTATASNGTGNTGTLSVKLTSPNGYAYLNAANLIVNSGLTYQNGCVLWYDRPSNGLYMWNGSGWDAPLTIGVTGTLSSAQCSVNTGTSTVVPAGNDLTLNLAITFANGFIGSGKNVYGWVGDRANADNGVYPQIATWTPVATAPSLVSVTAGSTVSVVLADVNGYSYINAANIVINKVLNWANSCNVWYDLPSNTLYLWNGSGWDISPLGAGGTTLANSQCSLNGAASTVTGAGNTLTLNLALNYTSAMAGVQNVYVWSNDKADASTGYQTSTTTINLP